MSNLSVGDTVTINNPNMPSIHGQKAKVLTLRETGMHSVEMLSGPRAGKRLVVFDLENKREMVEGGVA